MTSMNRWTAIEDEKLKETFKKYPKDWRIIAQHVGKTERQCEERMRKINKDIGAPTAREAKMRKPTETWTLAEDILLLQLTERQGQVWDEIKDRIKSKEALNCKRRYEYIRESEYIDEVDEKDLQEFYGNWSEEDEKIVLFAYKVYGGDWKRVMKKFPRRTLINVQEKIKQLLNIQDFQEWNSESDRMIIKDFLKNATFDISSKELGKTTEECDARFNELMKKLDNVRAGMKPNILRQKLEQEEPIRQYKPLFPIQKLEQSK